MKHALHANMHRCRLLCLHLLRPLPSAGSTHSRNCGVNGCSLSEELGSIHCQMSSSVFRGFCSPASSGKDAKNDSEGRSYMEQSAVHLSEFSRFYPFRSFLVLYRAANIMIEVAMLSFWHFFLKDIQKRAVKIRHTLIRLGPFYIKLGQALSTRPDMLPNAYCQELSKLQDQIPPFASSIALQCIEDELRSPVMKLFAEISPEPVAAASLGQVYKARLYSGESVAVKVQRPGMPLRLAVDAYLLRMIGGQLRRFLGARGDIIVAVNDMVGRMFKEIDYIQEGQNAERFAALYGIQETKISEHRDTRKTKEANMQGRSRPERKRQQKIKFSKNVQESNGLVKVPKVFWHLSSKAVLTMEWIDGIKLTDKEALREAKLNNQQLVDQGVFCSLKQLLTDGFFHGDPHPGNLVVTKEGVLAYFDFGMMGDFPRHYRIGLIRTLIHFVNRDSWGLANDFLFLGFVPEGVSIELIAHALRASFGDESSKSQLDFQGIMNQLSNVMYDFKFTLPPEYAMVIRALGSLEGTAKMLDPDFKVVASAYPFLVGRLLSDPASDMRQILRELLIRSNGSIRWNRLERLIMAIADHSLDSSGSKTGNTSEGSRMQKHFHQATTEIRGLSFDTRAVASATEDILSVILSEQGLQIRLFLVHDILKVFDAFLLQEVLSSLFVKGLSQKGVASEEGKTEGSTAESPLNSSFSTGKDFILSSRVATGIIAFVTVVQSAPEIWIPLLAKYSLKRETIALLGTLIFYIAQISCIRTSEATWLFISRMMHEAN